MKNQVKNLLCAVFLATLTPMTATAIVQKYTDGAKIVYQYDTNGTEASVAKSPNVSGIISILPRIVVNSKIYTVTSIEEEAFRNTAVTSVTIPNTVKTIGNYAFYGCSSMQSVSIPNSVTKIGKFAFGACKKLPSVVLPNALDTISQGVFSGCRLLQSVTIPNSVTTISRSAFSGCALPSFTIPNSVTTIGARAFEDAGLWPSITLPNSLTSIGDSAFANSNLQEIELPNSLTTIGNHVFRECKSLKTVKMPNSILLIGNAAFWGCQSLETIDIPNSVISIGAWAFSDCKGLTSVTIPNSVISIGAWAFSDCKGLTSVTIPNSVISIEGCAFWRCEKLASVVIPNSVMSIGKWAFEQCISLTSVVIGKSVTGIGEDAFMLCPNLTSVTSYVEVPFDLEDRAFGNKTYTDATLYVPAASLGLYKTTKYWTLFQNIQPIATLAAVTLTARSYTREYGEANPVFEYDAVGGALSGEPVVTCTADETSPVGDYPIVIEQGTVENELTLVNGTLTITKAPLDVSVGDYTREEGEANPEFVIVYGGWKLGEDESVLIRKPVATTTATVESAPGWYPIEVSGGEAENYEFSYYPGMLTVTESTSGIEQLPADGQTFDIFNVTGLLVKKDATSLRGLKKGVYIVKGQKVVVR